MNVGLISVGVSHRSGDAFRAGFEATDILADLEPHDHGSLGSHRDAIFVGMDVNTASPMLS